jgi:cation diffusion facilitator family transporter
LLIAAAKFAAGLISRSSAMISEGIHSSVDCFNELFLLIGIRKSNRKRDKLHPFGYGRELYLWSFLVAIMIFGFGAIASFIQGYQRLAKPGFPEDLFWNNLVLGFSFLFDGLSFFIALRAFNKLRGAKPFWQAIHDSKDPSTFMVLLEDGASLTGVFIVFVCLWMGKSFHITIMDGVASIIIGILLSIVSFILGKECRSLILGEGISPQKEAKIAKLVREQEHAGGMHSMFSVYMSPDEILIILFISFDNSLHTKAINEAIASLKRSIFSAMPEISYIIIEPWTSDKKQNK